MRIITPRAIIKYIIDSSEGNVVFGIGLQTGRQALRPPSSYVARVSLSVFKHTMNFISPSVTVNKDLLTSTWIFVDLDSPSSLKLMVPSA